MTQDELIAKISEKIEDLGWDYDRFSKAGKQTYEELCALIHKLKS